MIIKKDFVLKKIGEETIVVPVGENEFNGVIKLNDSAAFIWRLAVEGVGNSEIAEKMSKSFKVTYEKALSDVEKFEQRLKENGIAQS